MAKRTAARTDTGRVREGNEDRYLVREERDLTLLAVADGVGGGPGGEVAADAAVQELALRFFAAAPDRPVAERLGDAVREANTAVLRAAESSGHATAASTLVAVAVRGDVATFANLGDSRAYLVRDGAPRQVTEDHSGALAHGITRFVGDPRGVQADVYLEELRAGDRIVLCSDGLTRHVGPEEIAATLAGSADADAAAGRLVALANERGGEDNVTVIVHAVEAPRATTSRRGLAIGLFAGFVLFVVAGTLAVLLWLASGTPAPARVSPSASATASASPAPSPTETPAPSPSPTATP